MKTTRGVLWAAACLMIFAGLATAALAAEKKPKISKEEKVQRFEKDDVFAKTFKENKADFVSTGKNPYFSLEPGYVLYLRGEEEGSAADLTITVLDETKMVDGVETRVVEERETRGGKLTEVSLNYFAISKKTNNVYYFGEETRDYKEDGTFKIAGDSWESGKDGAKYGMIMPAKPVLGDCYYQEVAPGKAMDRAKNVSLTETLEVPAGKFEKVFKTEESTPLEKATEYKWYAPGIGLLKDKDLVLVKYGKGLKAPEAKPAQKAAGVKKAAKQGKAGAQEGKAEGRNEPPNKTVKLSDIPAVPRATIEILTAGGEIRMLEKEEHGGQVIYDVEATIKGRDVEFDVAADGKVLTSEESVPYSSLPKAVQAAAEKRFGSAEGLKTSREVEDGKIFFEVEGPKGAVKLTDSGQIVEEE